MAVNGLNSLSYCFEQQLVGGLWVRDLILSKLMLDKRTTNRATQYVYC